MAVISDFRVLDVLLVGLPESLNSSGALVLVSHIVSPGALNAGGHIVPIPISHRLQCKELKANQSAPFGGAGRMAGDYSLRVLDKSLRNTHLPFIL